MDDLKGRTVSLGALVERALDESLAALFARDAERAVKVVQADREIDRLEVEIEEECLKVLALHQPVAADLRFVAAILKLTNDLERIGDLAVDLSQRAASLAWQPPIAFVPTLSEMADPVKSMVRRSLDSLVELDSELAREVLIADDEIDELHRRAFQEVTDRLREQPEHVDAHIQMLSTSRYLERIADHATNIAEDVIYFLEGQIVRHETRRRTTEGSGVERPVE